MEYRDLELLWKRYDEKLDNLEKINRKLLKDTLLTKPQKKLDRLKFSSLYGLIAVPVIILIASHPNFTVENVDWKFALGCLFVLGVVLYLCFENLRSYWVLRKIDLSSDTLIQSQKKVVKLKRISDNFRKYVFLYYPILYAGGILIGWNGFAFKLNTLFFLSVLFVVTYYMNIWGVGRYKERINKLEKDIQELKEYTEE